MAKLSILLLMVCTACVLDRSVGLNYFIQTNLGSPGNPDLLTYPYVQPFPVVWKQWKQDCDKSKEGEDSSSSSESGSSESSSSSESNSSEESKESEESGESRDSEESKEAGESKESKSEEGSSSSESKDSSESSEESDKKKDKKKEPKYIFPPRPYDFPPASNVQKIVYSPLTYLPYRSTYVVQPSAVSYPQKSGYQYVSVPSTPTVVSGYPSPIMGRSGLMNSPITKIVYSPSSLTYPVSSKSIFSPGAQIYSKSWGSPLGYFKK